MPQLSPPFFSLSESMKYVLVSVDGSLAKLIGVQATFGPSPQLGLPEFFDGRLLRLTPEQVVGNQTRQGCKGWQ